MQEQIESMRRIYFTILFLSVTFLSKAQQNYIATINAWHDQRVANLKKDNGWLNLVGLYWLKPGKNSFGSDADMQVQFPKATILDNAGYFEVKGTTVMLHINNKVGVQINGNEKNDAIIFSADSSKPALCSYGSLRWTIIKRDDKLGIRLRDLDSKQQKEFTGIERFNVDSNFKVNAYLEKPQRSSISITNVLGQTNDLQTPGKLIFTLKGVRYTLDALEEGDQLFILFGDKTSGEETYPAGRFLYADKPGADGTTILDFNKAYNPPCAFTPFATCPLPPKQNILPVAITAGEKNYEQH